MFKPSSRAQYALRAMIELAIREGAGPVQLRAIAEAQRISPKYLEQLVIALRRSGLVQAERGPHGGYELVKPANQTTAAEVITAVEGPLHLLDCVRSADACDRTPSCAARGLWTRVSEAIHQVLDQTTLADLREEQMSAQMHVAPCYQI